MKGPQARVWNFLFLLVLSNRAAVVQGFAMKTVAPTCNRNDTPFGRGAALRKAAMGISASLYLGAPAAQAMSPKQKAEELYRIWNQLEADEGLGELASPEGGKTIPPVLALIPIVRLRLILDIIDSKLHDQASWEDAARILAGEDFKKKNFKRAFNAYSDNIYYLPGSDRENKYLQGGATPSTRQTLQYLLRNEAIDNIDGLSAEVNYLIRERGEETSTGEGGGGDLDTTDMWYYLSKAKESFDRYLGMVTASEVDGARAYAKMNLETKPL
ncbi:unnamed protein product [Choristocarpus tenellus]